MLPSQWPHYFASLAVLRALGSWRQHRPFVFCLRAAPSDRGGPAEALRALPEWSAMWSTFSCAFCALLGELSMQALSRFVIRLLSFRSSLYIQDFNPLSDI